MKIHLVATGILDETARWAVDHKTDFLCSYQDKSMANKIITLLKQGEENADRAREVSESS